jgi:hypothetical protein
MRNGGHLTIGEGILIPKNANLQRRGEYIAQKF